MLRAADVPAEAGDDLVQHEQHAVLVAQPPQSREVARLRRDGRLHLEDERRDRTGMRLEQRLHRPEVVEREAERQIPDRSGDARAHRRRPDEPVVGREGLVAADRDQVPAGVGTREPHGRRRGASEPLTPNFTISADGMSSTTRSAASRSSRCGRVKLLPWASASVMASTTAGRRDPAPPTAGPSRTPRTGCPSASQTWQPRPRSMTGPMPAGYWSSRLAYVCASPGMTHAATAACAAERACLALTRGLRVRLPGRTAPAPVQGW